MPLPLTERLSGFRAIFSNFFGFILGYKGISFLTLLIIIFICFHFVDTLKQPTLKEKIAYFTIHFAEPITTVDYRNYEYSQKAVDYSGNWDIVNWIGKIKIIFLIMWKYLEVIFNLIFWVWYFWAVILIFNFFSGQTNDMVKVPTYKTVIIGVIFALFIIIMGNLYLVHYYNNDLHEEFINYLDESYFIPYKGTFTFLKSPIEIFLGKTKEIVTEMPNYEQIGVNITDA